jgi:hypothetical protein
MKTGLETLLLQPPQPMHLTCSPAHAALPELAYADREAFITFSNIHFIDRSVKKL